MATGLSDSQDRPSRISQARWTRRDRLERQFLDKVRGMASFHLTGADGVERAAYALVEELREEGSTLRARAPRHQGAGVPECRAAARAHPGDRAALYHLLLRAAERGALISIFAV
jgi:hypothetical protein